ncbi:MAG TPA: HIT family protein [Candidatus Wolfebacteria bacterium]|nr:HIT family protein [Candidatus Wolfebacteria bacterium]
MPCLFCKIINKEIQADLIYNDDDTIGILDIHPVAPGHTMIIPKFHSENILDLPDDKIGAVFSAVKKITEILDKSLNPDGFTIGINHGRVSGQAVDHLHIHIIPRFKNDKGGSIHTIIHNPPKESLEEIKKKIKA